MPETAEELSKKTEVREALAQTSGQKKVQAPAKEKLWFVTYLLVLLGLAVLHVLIGAKFLPLAEEHVGLLLRAIRGTVLIVIVLTVAKAVTVYAIGRIEDASTRFTLKRVEHLIVGLLVILIAV